MATTGVINGTDLLMYSDGNPIAYSTSCSLGFTQNTIETTNKDTGSWETFIAGRRGGTISCDGFVALDSDYNYSYLYGLMMEQSTVWLRFSTNITGDKYYQVQALLTDLSLEAPDNDNMSFSVSFRTVGSPQEVTLT